MNPVKLLWTGGWDSTFRLIQLMVETDAVVSPIYLVDDDRLSAPVEIERMRELRARIGDLVTGASERILPTDFYGFRTTEIALHHREAWEELKKRGRVGVQYPLLASFAEQRNLEGIELGLENYTGDGFSIPQILKPYLEVVQTELGTVSYLRDDTPWPESMFRPFTLPIIHLTKHDMRSKAAEWGAHHIMERTWFCFSPILGRPCGECRPCKVARIDGFGRRVGYIGPALKQSKRFISRVHRRVWSR